MGDLVLISPWTGYCSEGMNTGSGDPAATWFLVPLLYSTLNASREADFVYQRIRSVLDLPDSRSRRYMVYSSASVSYAPAVRSQAVETRTASSTD